MLRKVNISIIQLYNKCIHYNILQYTAKLLIIFYFCNYLTKIKYIFYFFMNYLILVFIYKSHI